MRNTLTHLVLVLIVLTGVSSVGLGDSIVFYSDSAPANGQYDAGEDDSSIVITGDGGTQTLNFDLPAGAVLSSVEVIVDFVTADDVDTLNINGTAYSGSQIGTTTGTGGDFGTMQNPWNANDNGLPRYRLYIEQGGITLAETTPAQADAALTSPAPIQNNVATWSPSYQTGQNSFQIIVRNGGGPDGVNAVFSGTYDIPEPATMSLLGLGGLAMCRRRRR